MKSRPSDLEAITAGQLTEYARMYLSRDRASRVTILPVSSPVLP